MNEQRTRVIIIIFTVIVGLGVASIPLFAGLREDFDQPDAQPNSTNTTSTTEAPKPAQSVNVTNEVQCPEPQPGVEAPADSELADVELPCLTTGGQATSGNLAEQLAGKVSVVNVWAWWCGPCREELPMMQSLGENHPEWNVVGVHMAEEGQAGVDFLNELGVDNFASYQDASHVFDSATGIPKVVPITLVYRADGTRAAMLPKAFTSDEELETAVQDALNGTGN